MTLALVWLLASVAVVVSGCSSAPAGSGGVSGVYGSGFAIDSLQNIRVGGPYSESVSNRFRAERSGSLTAFRTWFKNHTNPGYGAGDGGIMSVTVETDNGGVPSGTVLGRAEHRPGAPDANGINPGRFSLVSFDAPVPVIAGQVSHVVYRNTSPDPQANYSSVNGTYIFGSNRPSPLQPLWTDDSLASLRKIGSKAWTVFAGVSPMLDLTYADGTHQGQGYIEPVYSSPAITGASKMVRERFTVSGGDRLVTGASVRIAKTSGTGDLVVRLEKGDGTLVDSLKIPTADVPTLDRTANGPAGIWVSGSFSSPRTLANGATYHLRLSTDQTTTLWTRIIKSGDGYGFNPATNFHDGYAQVTTDGGSTWAYGPSVDQNGELQFALHQAPA